MQRKDDIEARNVQDSTGWFTVLQNGSALQTATMLLEPGNASGPMGNEHAKSEQVLYVVEGEVTAEIGDRKFVMGPGDCVIVPREVPHRFRNESAQAALTFNVYSPPAY